MIDAALIQKCADPGLKPAIVEQFIKQAGNENPLSIALRSGEKVYLVPTAKTPEEALETAKRYLGQAVVRVGITQYPAGLGLQDKSTLSPDLFDACKNIKLGTALFAKVYRIVTKWYGNAVPQAFDDAVYAWGTGYFDGKYVFAEPDPGDKVKVALPKAQVAGVSRNGEDGQQSPTSGGEQTILGTLQQRLSAEDPNKAGIAVDLSGIAKYNVSVR
jgi:hypothetical protein